MSYHSVFTVMPANAEPLLLAAEVNAYSTSEKPWAPEFSIPARSPGSAIATPVPISTMLGVVRMYSEANFISRPPSFLPRYSGVRPTIRPATNTATTARISIPYRPEPVPPGAISPSIMLKIVRPPPKGVYESWKEFTAPVDVSVVEAAKRPEAAMPNRCSLPSIAAPAAFRAAPPCCDSAKVISAAEATQNRPITATIA